MKKITLKFTALLLGSALATSVLATENSSNSSTSDYELENIPRMSGRNGMCHQVISRQKERY